MEDIDDQQVKVKYEMSYAKNPVRQDFKIQTVTETVRHWANSKPEENAFVFVSTDGSREAVTWRDVYDKSVLYAKAFRKLGVKEREVVGLTLINCPQWIYIALGAVFAGAIPLGLEFTYRDGRDVVDIMRKVERCSIFILDTESDTTSWGIFKSFLSSYSKDGTATSDAMPSIRYLLSTSVANKNPDIMTIEELLQVELLNDVELPEVALDDIVVMFQTSGTTGPPKIVAHSHKSIALCYTQSYVKHFFRNNETVYDDSLFSWCEASPVVSGVLGKTKVIGIGLPPMATERGELVLNMIKKESCTMLVGMPTLIRSIMAAMDARIGVGDTHDGKPLLHTICCSAQPITKSVVSSVGSLCSVFINLYGTSESLDNMTKFITSEADFEDYNCGKVMEGYEAKIVNDAGEVVPVRTRGELYVRGAMFSGYFNAPEETRAVLTDDGWYKTDDISFMTENGEFFVEGRKSNLIICGGVHCYPADLESVFQAMPGIRDAVIVPIPDDIYYQVICACIIVSPGSDVTEEKLEKYCDDVHLDVCQDYNDLPSHYLFFDKFPESSTGKINRRALQEQAVQRIQSKETETVSKIVKA